MEGRVLRTLAVVGVAAVGVYTLYSLLGSSTSSKESERRQEREGEEAKAGDTDTDTVPPTSSSSSSSVPEPSSPKHVHFDVPAADSPIQPPPPVTTSSFAPPRLAPSTEPDILPHLSTDQKKQVQTLLDEVLASADVDEAARCVRAVMQAAGKMLSQDDARLATTVEVTKRGFHIALDRSEREREVMTTLISSLETRGVMASEHIMAGLDLLLHRLADIRLDAPSAGATLADFIANLVLLNAVPEEYVFDKLTAFQLPSPLPHPLPSPAKHPLPGTGGEAQVIGYAVVLLEGRLPVSLRQMKTVIRRLLVSSMRSGDLDALDSQVLQLYAPQYHFEVVVKLVQLTLDKPVHVREYASYLLAALSSSGRLAVDQVTEGFFRLLRSVDELALDTPDASDRLARFIVRAVLDNALPTNFLHALPSTVDPASVLSPTRNTTAVQQRPLTPDGSGSGSGAGSTPPPPAPKLVRQSSSVLSPAQVASRSKALHHTLTTTRRLLRDATASSSESPSKHGSSSDPRRVWGCITVDEAIVAFRSVMDAFFGSESVPGASEEETSRALQDLDAEPFLFLFVRELCLGAMQRPFADAARGSGLVTLLRNSLVLSELNLRRGLFMVLEALEYGDGVIPEGGDGSVPWLLSLLIHTTRTGVLSSDFFELLPEHLQDRLSWEGDEDDDDDDSDDDDDDDDDEAGRVDRGVDMAMLSPAAKLKLRYERTVRSDEA